LGPGWSSNAGERCNKQDGELGKNFSAKGHQIPFNSFSNGAPFTEVQTDTILPI
jgi:hypothetical protein